MTNIARSSFPPTLLGLLQTAQVAVTRARELQVVEADYLVIADTVDTSRVVYCTLPGTGRPAAAEHAQLQAKLTADGYIRCAEIDMGADLVRITARDSAGNKLTSRACSMGGVLAPWSQPVAEVWPGRGLLGLPVKAVEPASIDDLHGKIRT